MFLSSDKNKKAYRCAVYCRLSDQEKGEVSQYDSIEAQRDLCEKYISIHAQDGWKVIPTRYDDRNYSGGKLERPALKRLLEDAKAGKFDMIVVKAIDRFTRSLKHFYFLWEDVLQALGVELASATQEFNTASPTGRLHLDIVLRFAQYERELASQRTKEKMEFRARKGLFHGGYPPLGFDFDIKQKGMLRPNAKQISLVKLIFRKYAELQSANLVAKYCNKNGYLTKSWKTKGQQSRGGNRFTEAIVMNILRNVAYIGRTGNLETFYPAQWKGFINRKLFERVQQIIKNNTVRRHTINQNKHRLLLIGLVWCSECGSIMTHNTAVKKDKTYLYYQCTKVGHSDKTACSVRRVAARALDNLVIERMRFLSERRDLVEKITALAVRMARKKIPILRAEKNRIVAQLQKVEREAAPLIKAIGKKKLTIIQEKLLVLDSQRETLKTKLDEIDEEMTKEKMKVINPVVVCQNLQYFNAVFNALPFEKQRDLAHLLIKKIVYHKDPSKVTISFYNLPEIKNPPGNPKKGHSGGSSLSSRFDERMYWLPVTLPNQTTFTDVFQYQLLRKARGEVELAVKRVN